MQISFFTPRINFTLATGYGYATHNITNSLKELGHTVPYAYSKAPVQINFAQPFQFKMHRNQYQIGYTPWESTIVPSTWFQLLINVMRCGQHLNGMHKYLRIMELKNQ